MALKEWTRNELLNTLRNQVNSMLSSGERWHRLADQINFTGPELDAKGFTLEEKADIAAIRSTLTAVSAEIKARMVALNKIADWIL